MADFLAPDFDTGDFDAAATETETHTADALLFHKISFVDGYAQNTGDTNPSSITLNTSNLSGLAVGDVMIAAHFQPDGIPNITCTGWTSIRTTHIEYFGEKGDLETFWKVVDAADVSGTTHQFNTTVSDQQALCTLVYRGVNTTTPVHQSSGTGSRNTGVVVTCPTLTTTVNYCHIVRFGGVEDRKDSGWTTGTTYSSSSAGWNRQATIGGYVGVELETAGSAGTYAFSTMTENNSEWTAQTIALLPLSLSVNHTTDAVLASGVSTETKTHTTDAHLVDQETVTHTSDAHLVDRNTSTHTTDAHIVGRDTSTHTTDAILQATEDVSHSTDALLQAGNTETHATDAVLQATETVGHSTDAHVVDRDTHTHTTDGHLVGRTAAAHTADGHVVGRGSANHTTDSILQATESGGHATDAVLSAQTTVDHDTDAVLQATETGGQTTDAVLLGTSTEDHTTDALLTHRATVTHTSDAFLSKIVTITTLYMTAASDLNMRVGADPTNPDDPDNPAPPVGETTQPTITGATVTRRDGTTAARTENINRRIVRK